MKATIGEFLLSCSKKNFINPESKESKAIQVDRLKKFRKMGDFAIKNITSPRGESK